MKRSPLFPDHIFGCADISAYFGVGLEVQRHAPHHSRQHQQQHPGVEVAVQVEANVLLRRPEQKIHDGDVGERLQPERAATELEE